MSSRQHYNWPSEQRRKKIPSHSNSSSTSNYQVPSLVCSTANGSATYSSSMQQSSFFSQSSSSVHNPPSTHRAAPQSQAPFVSSSNVAHSMDGPSVASARSLSYHSCISSVRPAATICTNSGNNATKQSVKPYRFRDEPNKKNIVKTELCKSFLESGWCKFGAKCNFAHYESELKYQTLVERDEANLCDIETHRTRPCFYHIATGDCPFGLRCTCLHDTRVDGETDWWLPNCALKSTHLETNAHVEWYAKDIFSLQHYGHPFGKDRDPSKPILKSWDNFCKLIGNEDKVHPNAKFDHKFISYHQRLQIALSMRHDYDDVKTVYRYQPTHKILNEICMLVQTKAFDIKSPRIAPLSLNEFDLKNPNHVIVREVAFGPLSSPSDRPLALWFNIPDDYVEKCTPKEMLRLKRTERKLLDKKKMAAAQKKVSTTSSLSRATYADITGSRTKSCRSAPISFDDKSQDVEMSFDIYVPLDEVFYQLTTDMLEYQCKVSSRDESIPFCDEESKRLEERFCAMKYHYSNFFWPVNEGREFVDRTTVVPKVDTQYNVRESATPGKNGSYQAKMWKSFIETMSKFEHNDDSQVANVHNDKTRCNIFAPLSQGVSLSESSQDLPHIKTHGLPPGLSPDIGIFTKKQENDWDVIQAHYLAKKEAQAQRNLVSIAE